MYDASVSYMYLCGSNAKLLYHERIWLPCLHIITLQPISETTNGNLPTSLAQQYYKRVGFLFVRIIELKSCVRKSVCVCVCVCALACMCRYNYVDCLIYSNHLQTKSLQTYHNRLKLIAIFINRITVDMCGWRGYRAFFSRSCLVPLLMYYQLYYCQILHHQYNAVMEHLSHIGFYITHDLNRK